MERFGRNIKESMEEVPVPKEKLEQTIQQAIVKAKHEKPRRKHRLFVSIASMLMVGILGVLITVLGYGEEEKLGEGRATSIFLEEDDVPYLKRLALNKQYTKLNVSSEQDGIKVTLEDVIYDQNVFAVSFRIEQEEERETLEIEQNLMLGHDANTFKVKAVYPIAENNEVASIFYIPYEDAKGWDNNLEVTMQITRIGEKKGEWDFVFNVDKYHTLAPQYSNIFYGKEILSEYKRIELNRYREDQDFAYFEGFVHLPKEQEELSWLPAIPEILPSVATKIGEGHYSFHEKISRANKVSSSFEYEQENYQNVINDKSEDYKATPIRIDYPLQRGGERPSFMLIPIQHQPFHYIRERELLENTVLPQENLELKVKSITHQDEFTSIIVESDKELIYFPFEMFRVYNKLESEIYPLLEMKMNGTEIELIYPKLPEQSKNYMEVPEIIEVYDELMLNIGQEE
ncbi:DUF4179 domain-containing protein [Alkalihalobacillus sp. 1P02AB]|uniref:DUF4179 domain-containing protein n=1 Tax=Alkalihalobacillus sp. 1P02AB TaxID=3132260 RepID=UPI0039A4467C